jgi:hypothetical protein
MSGQDRLEAVALAVIVWLAFTLVLASDPSAVCH